MDSIAEWTFEGNPKPYDKKLCMRVGVAGNLARYQRGTYVSTLESGHFVNLSGTAIIIFMYVLLPSQAYSMLGAFFII